MFHLLEMLFDELICEFFPNFDRNVVRVDLLPLKLLLIEWTCVTLLELLDDLPILKSTFLVVFLFV